MDSKGKRAGKGALIQEELAMTLGVTQDQYLFQPIENYRADGIIGGVSHLIFCQTMRIEQQI